MTETLGTTLQNLYDSEINVSIHWDWDGGVTVKIGGGLYNENWEQVDSVDTIKEAEAWLIAEALRKYPSSKFAENYRPNG